MTYSIRTIANISSSENLPVDLTMLGIRCYVHDINSLTNFNYIDTKAKCRHLKKLTCKGTLRQVFVCLKPPPLLGCCLGRSSNFVRSESSQIQNMVSNRTQHPHPPPSHTLFAYTVLWHWEEEESWTREKVRGATVHKAESKIRTCRLLCS